MRLCGLSVLFGLASLLFAGCQTIPDIRPDIKKIDTTPISQKVKTITAYSKEARSAISTAKKQLGNTSIDIDSLSESLEQADRALAAQQNQIAGANQEITRLQKATALSEKQYQELFMVSRQWEKEADRYERKYLKLTKYRWAVFSVLGASGLIIIAKIKGILL